MHLCICKTTIARYSYLCQFFFFPLKPATYLSSSRGNPGSLTGKASPGSSVYYIALSEQVQCINCKKDALIRRRTRGRCRRRWKKLAAMSGISPTCINTHFQVTRGSILLSARAVYAPVFERWASKKQWIDTKKTSSTQPRVNWDVFY